MKYGLFIQTTGRGQTDPASISAIAEAADRLGFDTAWIGDHIVVPETIESRYPFTRSGTFPMKYSDPFLEPLSTITFVLAKTTRLRVGPNVLIVPYRNPVVAAKTLATMDWLSGGRLTVGVGVGWMREEFVAVDAPPFEQRGRVTDEYLDVFRKIWTEELASHSGPNYQLGPVYAEPRPVQQPHPPIYVGGHAAPALRRVARIGAGWNAWRLSPAGVAEHRVRLNQELAAVGRSPESVEICLAQLLAVVDNAPADRPALTGSVAQIVEDLRAYREAGVGLVSLLLRAGTAEDTIAQMERFVSEIWPEVH